MLLPVGARSATTPAVSIAKPALSGEQPAAQSSPNPTVTAFSDPAATKLNLAMVSGQGRMSENVARVAEVVGEFLGLARGDLESPDAYLSRLGAAIEALPEADRLKLQNFVAKTFAKLQLNALMVALANPSGKDAITVAIAFEISREAPGDRQTRSVLSAYRQAAGDPLGPTREYGAYTSSAARAPAVSSTSTTRSSIVAQRPSPLEDVPQALLAEDLPRAASDERTPFKVASGLVRNGHDQPQVISLPTKAEVQPTVLAVEAQAKPVATDAEEGETTGGTDTPQAMRNLASNPVSRDHIGAEAVQRSTVKQALDPQRTSLRQGITLEKDNAWAPLEKHAEEGAEGAAKFAAIPVPASPLAPAPSPSGLGLNEVDLISNLLKLAQQVGASPEAGDAAGPNLRQTDEAATPRPQQGAPQDKPATGASAQRAGLARGEILDSSGSDTNAPPPLTTQSSDFAAAMPIAREAVPFAILHYLVHDEPEETHSRHQGDEDEEEFDDDRGGDGDPSDGEAGNETDADAVNHDAASTDEAIAVVDIAAQHENALTDQAGEPMEKYPKPRAQRLQEAEQLGPSHREFSAADPVHQMYLRMSGGI